MKDAAVLPVIRASQGGRRGYGQHPAPPEGAARAICELGPGPAPGSGGSLRQPANAYTHDIH
ncbi:hypothetical protein GCM10010384_23010 [Streptomyces djakartensis]|uniref:Uncharacterized protein n=1 Tax=Streptomyces djakartensis TaxID=68193 RepID=A0ABQ2ZKP7_9ACTN|nr:hypothetical protein GCM10010384_23010 [Streptomyces djakartensis]